MKVIRWNDLSWIFSSALKQAHLQAHNLSFIFYVFCGLGYPIFKLIKNYEFSLNYECVESECKRLNGISPEYGGLYSPNDSHEKSSLPVQGNLNRQNVCRF